MEYAITTYGGGEILWGVLNAITVLVNSGSGSVFTALVRLGLLIGGFAAIMGAVFKQNPLVFVRDWLLPFTLILNILFVPTTTVWVIDPVSKTHEKIDHVPWALGAFAGTVSEIGHVLTQKIENVFSLPDDLTYQKNGLLFASRLMMHARDIQIVNEETRENMREFVGQCVVYDALLGSKYSVEDLKTSTDLWGLISFKASPARSFIYRAPKEPGKSRPKTEIITCEQGVARFKALWQKECELVISKFAQKLFGSGGSGKSKLESALMRREILSNLPAAHGFLLNASRSAEAVIQQQMMMAALVDGIEYKSTSLGNAPNFAARRAYLQQRTTYQTLGEMAGESLPIMKNVLEALSYAVFLFVIPLALLPAGFRILSSWAGVVLWIQMWAPLYAVLNFIMTLTARARVSGLGESLVSGTENGFSLANAVNIYNLNADMSAMAGYLAMSIPFISHALVKGGVGAFVHLASHLGNITQGAASQAASEATTGNYSFGNTSLGTHHLNTMQAHQSNTLASWQAGGFRQSDGQVEEITTASGGRILNVSSSQLPTSITSTESDTNMLSRQASLAATAAENQSVAASKSEAEGWRAAHDLSMHQSRGSSVSTGLSQSENAHYSKAFNTISSSVESFAKSHGFSDAQSSQILASARVGLPFKELIEKIVGVDAGVGWNANSDAKRQEAYDHAKNMTQQSDYREALDTAASYGRESRSSHQDEATKRYGESMNANLERAQQYRQEASASYQKAQSFNEAVSLTRQNSTTLTRNLNQEYVDWLPNQSINGRGAPMGIPGAKDLIANHSDVNDMMVKRFLEQRDTRLENYFENQPIHSAEEVMKVVQGQTSVTKPPLGGEMSALKTQADHEGFGEKFSVQPPPQAVLENVHTTRRNIQQHLTETAAQVAQKKQSLEQEKGEQKKTVEEGLDQNVLVRPIPAAASRIRTSFKGSGTSSDKEKK